MFFFLSPTRGIDAAYHVTVTPGRGFINLFSKLTLVKLKHRGTVARLSSISKQPNTCWLHPAEILAEPDAPYQNQLVISSPSSAHPHPVGPGWAVPAPSLECRFNVGFILIKTVVVVRLVLVAKVLKAERPALLFEIVIYTDK